MRVFRWILIGVFGFLLENGVLFGSTVLSQKAGILGTSQSFFESSFCKEYQCNLSSRQKLSSQIEEFRYILKPQFDNSTTEGDVISVIRLNGKIVSAGFVMGVQDFGLNDNDYHNRLILSLIKTLMAVTYSGLKLEMAEEIAHKTSPKEYIVKIAEKKPYSISLILSGAEFIGAYRLSVRIY